MEIYEKIEIDIEYIGNEDVITTSSDHDNAYIDFDAFMDYLEEVFDDPDDSIETVNMDSLLNSDILE